MSLSLLIRMVCLHLGLVLIVDYWKDPGPYGVEQSWGIIGGGVDFL